MNHNKNQMKPKKEPNFNEFDVVFYDKVHNNAILKHEKTGNKNPLIINFERNEDGYFISDHIKTRPAIILKKFTRNRFLIVPLTTKIDLNVNLQDLFRTHFKSLDYKKYDSRTKTNKIIKSYLEWDCVSIVTREELNGFFRRKETGKLINMPESSRRFLIKTFSTKNQDIINFVRFKKTSSITDDNTNLSEENII